MGGKVKLTGKYADQALKMLADIISILEKENIPYLLEAGTLLGIIRENRLLPWDSDMDITVLQPYEKKLLSARKKMWLAGYRTRIHRYKKDTGPFKKGTVKILRIQTRKFLFFKGVSLMDIFLKTLIDDEYYWTVDDKHPVLKSCPRQYYEQLTQYEFMGKLYSVPADYKGYLTYHYGDWQVVKKEWNFRTDDNCKKVEL
ncbi:MAG TPA: LicD family protein [Candidatus Cloacimonadota bacterium]|nr:LicD family protein [Candidatus Cloacimonadota bacterium]HQL14223.1 LicD family protein [Candidatus Cloacimonadota bacterium]